MKREGENHRRLFVKLIAVKRSKVEVLIRKRSYEKPRVYGVMSMWQNVWIIDNYRKRDATFFLQEA